MVFIVQQQNTDMANGEHGHCCQNTHMPNRIKELRKAKKLTQGQLADLIGTNQPTLQRIENGDRGLTEKWVRSISKVLGCHPGELFLPLPATATAPLDGPTLLEIDVYGGLGGGGEALVSYVPDGNGGLMAADDVRAQWSLPAYYLESELRVRPDMSRIFEVLGDSMEPTLKSGDRVMVNLQDQRPTPPGLFALWDGMGVVVKRLDHIPNTDPPMLKVKSESVDYDDYERTIEEVNIIGRVIWCARRL